MTAPTSTSKSKINLKQCTDGVWKPITGVAGLTLRQIFQKLDGQAAVCEYRHGEKVWYFCGTENWKKTMKKRGTSVIFSEAIVLLDSVSPGWLEDIPVTEQMEEYMRMMGQYQPSLESYQED